MIGAAALLALVISGAAVAGEDEESAPTATTLPPIPIVVDGANGEWYIGRSSAFLSTVTGNC
jgi:hypothetical protein